MKLSNDVDSNLGTLSVRAGEKDYLLQGATQMPVVHSVSFGYPDVDQWLQVALGEKPGHIYSRNSDRPPATTSHDECTFQERSAMGIPQGLIRYSAGIEDTEDLVADLRQALTAIQ